MYQPPIVNFPVFSVTWSEATDAATGASSPAVLTAGGGGAGNTGVGNKISLIAFEGGANQPSHAIAHEIETSPETCNCVAASDNGQLLAAAFGKEVRIYASNPSGFYQMAKVQADFATKESGVNSMAFVDGTHRGGGGGSMLLATGGEDGVLRVWELRANSRPGSSDEGDGCKPPSLSVNMVKECRGHGKPVTCVRFHPSAKLVLTASKDGTCRLWDWERGSEAAMMTTTSGLPPTASAAKTPAIMCRSCCFSPDKPTALFSVQSGPRGNAYVTEWRYLVRPVDAGGRGIAYDVSPVKVALVSPHPATSLSIRSDGARLAVGNVEGTVLVYRLPGFAKVVEYPAHDLPVTGLCFASKDAGAALGGYDLLAGSADYKITLFKSQGSATKLAVRQAMVFLWSLIVFLFKAIYWLVRISVAVALTVVPILGLVALVLAVVYRPHELAAVTRALIGQEEDSGLDDADPDSAPPIVA